MNILSFLAAVAPLLAMAGPGESQAAEPAQVVAAGSHAYWTWSPDRPTRTYKFEGLEIEVRGDTSGDDPDHLLVRPVVTVTAPGHPPVMLEGGDVRPSYPHLLTFAHWEDGRPYVRLQSFTGGAHCCNEVQLAVPAGDGIAAVHLGSWDGDYDENVPGDLDGDGRIDFQFIDQGFLYAFASYADSYAPPVVLNVIDGRVVDVSDRPGFQPLFEAARVDLRRACVTPDQDRMRNGACAAYVAAAARAGRFDDAWAEMIEAHDRESDWPLPAYCRVPDDVAPCPEGEVARFQDYPSALRHWLVAKDYIAR